MLVTICLQLSMMVSVPRSGEILRRVSPETMVGPTRRVETFRELLFGVSAGNFHSPWQSGSTSVSLRGSSVFAFALIDFNLLKQCLHFFIHASTLLNLLPNCLHNLRGCCPKWFFGSHDRVLTLASQRSCCGASPFPKLVCGSCRAWRFEVVQC